MLLFSEKSEKCCVKKKERKKREEEDEEEKRKDREAEGRRGENTRRAVRPSRKQADNKDTHLDCRVTITGNNTGNNCIHQCRYPTPPPCKLVLQDPMTHPVGRARMSFPVTNTMPSKSCHRKPGEFPDWFRRDFSSLPFFMAALHPPPTLRLAKSPTGHARPRCRSMLDR